MKVIVKYFGCPIGPDAPMDQIRSGTFTCTQDCEDGEDWRECITTNVRTVGPVETVYLTQWIYVGSNLNSLCMIEAPTQTS